MSFASMKKNNMSFEDLSKEIEKSTGGNKSYKDDRVWYPKLDENKNGYAVIRFLPPSADGELPFAKMYTHGFKGESGGWFFENCPTTKGNECPVCAANKELMAPYDDMKSAPADIQKIVRNRKRKLSYYSNIYVVSDPENPENEGKVFLFKYGMKIFGQLKEAAAPTFKDKEAIQPFDMWDGANYKLKIRQVEGQTNYDSSEFELASQFLPTDDEMEAVFNQQYLLSEKEADSEFKEYADLETGFNRAEGGAKSTATAATIDEKPMKEKVSTEAPKFKEAAVEESSEGKTEEESDEDIMDYFNTVT